MTVPSPPELTTTDLVTLYGIEANLIQQKISHILTIRSIAISVFAAVAGIAIAFPNRGLQFLSLVLVPFFVLDSVYDAYLIPMVSRETNLRALLAARCPTDGLGAPVASAYHVNVDHRVTGKTWNPFLRTFLEPIRLLFYVSLIMLPIVGVAIWH